MSSLTVVRPSLAPPESGSAFAWRLACFLAALAAPAASAQTAADSVVQSPGVVVSGTALPSDAGGATRIELQPEVGPAGGGWEQLSNAAANFHVSDGGAGGYGSLFALRGLSNTPYFSEPAVTVYFADIPLPSSFTYPTALFGFNSVALFRGPQGTQFGRATDGGVVIFSPDEAPTSAGGELLAGFGSYEERQVAATARTPLGPDADVTVNAGYDAREGYITNEKLGIRVDDQENENAFARFRLRPAKGAELTFEALDTRGRDGAQPLVPIGGPLFDVERAKEGITDLDSVGFALKGTFALPSYGTLSAVTSYTDWRMDPYRSFLVLPPPLDNQIIQDQKSWNEELHFRSDPLGSIRVESGAWLSKGTTDNSVDRAIPGLFPIEVSSFEQKNTSVALFGQVAWTPDPAWTLVAGLRAETDAKDFARQEQVPTAGLDYNGNGRYDGLLPRVAADWALSPDSHAEVAVAEGLRPGGFASYTDNPALISFAAEHSTAYSLGWDKSFGQTAVDIGVRAFYDAITNFQIERSFTETDYYVATAPTAHAAGAEVEGHWHPSRDWTVGISAGWTRVQLDRFFAPVSGENESGNAAPNSPQYNADLEVTYRPGRGWFAAGQLVAVGKTYYDELESSRYTQGAYALVGLRAGFETRQWTFTLFGENLADRGYYELIIPGVNSANPGDPRRFGARAAVRF